MADKLSRRGALALLGTSSLHAGKGNPDWDRHFRAFIKQLNRFLESLNDGINDRKQWKRVEEAWKELEA